MAEILTGAEVRVSARPHPYRQERVDLHVPAGLSIAEILEVAQPDPVLRRHAHVSIDADLIPPERWHQVRPKPGALVTVGVVPSGGDGKNPLNIILQIAVLAAAIAIPILGVPALGLAAGSLGAAFAGAAFGVVGSLLVNAIAPPPTPKFDRLSAQADSPTYSITGGSNELRPWGPVPLLAGRWRMFPPFAAQPYTEIDGDDQYWRVMFLCGYGRILMEDHKIGETPIEDFPDVEIEVREGTPSDPPRELFTSDVFEESLSIELTEAASWQQRTAIQEADEISVDITFPSGLAVIADSGSRQDRTVNVEVEYSPAGANQWSVGSSGAVFAARQVGPMAVPGATMKPGGLAQIHRIDRVVMDKQSGALRVLTGSPKAMVLVSGDDHGLFIAIGAALKAPVVPPNTISVAQILRVSGESPIIAGRITDERPANPPFGAAGDFAPAPTAPASDSIEIAAGTIIFTGIETTARQTTTVRRGLRFALPTRMAPDIRLRRTTPDTTNPQVVDKVFWTALRAIRNVDPIQLANVATVALRIRATGSLSGVIQRYNCIGTSVVPDWTGSAWVDQPTNNPASLYRWAFQGPHMKRPRTDAQMDLVGLQAWAEANAADRRAFSAYIDFSTTLRELTGDIAAAGRASRGMIDGKWGVMRDRKQTVPAQMFTPRNSWGFQGTKALVDPPHGLNARFINETIGYKRDERPIYADGFDELTATRLETLDLFGFTDPELVWQEGRFLQAVFKLRPETYELFADFEHLVAMRGDLVLVAHDAMLVGLAHGRIKAVQVDGGGDATGVTLDELMTMELGKTYALTVRPPDTDPITRAVTTAPGETNTVVFSTTIPAGVIQVGDLAAFGETDRVTAEMIIREIRPGPNESAKLILVDAAPEVHDADVLPVDFFPGDVDAGTDRIAIADNPFFDGDILQLTSTDTLPPSIPSATDTFVVGRDDAGIQVSLTKGGAPIDLTGGGTGTHTATRQIPPFDSKVTLSAGVAAPAVESVASDGKVLFRDVDGSLSSRILVRLIRASGGRSDLSEIEGRYRVAGTDAAYSPLPKVSAELSEYSILPVQDGESYEFQLRYVTTSAERGDWGPSVIHLVEGKSAKPRAPDSFTGTRLADGTRRYDWIDANPDLDVRFGGGYLIRFFIGITSDWDVMTPMHDGLLTVSPYETNSLPAGDYTVAIKSSDSSGNDSEDALFIALTLGDPPLKNVLLQLQEDRDGWPGTLTDAFIDNNNLICAVSTQGWDDLPTTWDALPATWDQILTNASPIRYETTIIDLGVDFAFTPLVSVSAVGAITVEMKIGTDADGTVVGAYAPAASASSARYLQIRVSVTGTTPKISALTILIDADTETDRFENVNTATEAAVWFNRLAAGHFEVGTRTEKLAAITTARIEALQNVGPGFTWELISKNKLIGSRVAAAFKIYDATNTLADATADIILRGPKKP